MTKLIYNLLCSFKRELFLTDIFYYFLSHHEIFIDLHPFSDRRKYTYLYPVEGGQPEPLSNKIGLFHRIGQAGKNLLDEGSRNTF
jgi:hypothetical protein